jgi:hypothetical protein
VGAFNGLPPVIAKTKEWNRALVDINASLGQTVTDWKNGTTAVQGFATAMFALVDIQKELAAGYASQAGANQQNPAYNAAFADKLQGVVDRITSIMGPDNFFAAAIGNEIEQVRKGVLSPQEAMQVIQAVLAPYIPGLMQEIADPSTSPAQRELDLFMERFLESGAFA